MVAEKDVMDDSLPEEVLLDENAEAEKHSFYMVGGFEVSPNQQLLAWAEDTVGGGRLCPSPAPSLLHLTSRTLGICMPDSNDTPGCRREVHSTCQGACHGQTSSQGAHTGEFGVTVAAHADWGRLSNPHLSVEQA